MDRYFEVAPAGTAPTAPPANPGYPTNGNPGGAVPASEPGAWWFHMFTEEIRGVITSAGLTPDHTNLSQLSQAIAALVQAGQRTVVISPATFAAGVANGNVVYWDSAASKFDKALADGSAKQNAVGVADVTNSKVIAFGDAIGLFSGLTPGGRYYLNATTAGTITTTAPANAVYIGIAKTATEVFVDIDAVSSNQAGLAAAKNLDIHTDFTTPASKVVISADELIIKDTGGNPTLLSAVSVTVDMAVSGAGGLDTGAEAANTWYYLWAIYNQSTQAVAGLISASATAPTMPSGYTHKALVSVVRNDAASNFLAYHQKADLYQYKLPVVVLNAGTATTITPISLASVVPTQAKSILAMLSKSGGPSNLGAYYGYLYAGNVDTSVSIDVAAYTSASVGLTTKNNGELLLEWPEFSPNIYYKNTTGTDGTLTVTINGFRLAGVCTF